MRRLALLLAATGVLAVGCTGSDPTPEASTPSDSKAAVLAKGRVSLSLVAYCGAGSHPCPAAMLRLVNGSKHSGYLIATPDTVLVGGFGCGGSFPAPDGSAVVTATQIRWRVKWTRSASLDCDGQVLAFARSERPVFDMRKPIPVRTDDRTRDHVSHTRAWPTPDLARWASGQDMTPYTSTAG